MNSFKGLFRPRLLSLLLFGACAAAIIYNASSAPVPDKSAIAAPPDEFLASAKGKIDIEGGVVRLAARRDGVIDKVFVEEGAIVKAGEILATLDGTLAGHKLELARSELDEARDQTKPHQIRIAAAQREIRRVEPLVEKKIASQQTLDNATDQLHIEEAELVSARARVDTAERHLRVAEREVEEHIVRAPADGQIIQRQARPGNGVSTLNVTPLFLFIPDVPKVIRAELEERFIGAVTVGEKAQVILDSDQNTRFDAQVIRVGRVVGQRTPSDDPTERQDNRVIDCVLSIDAKDMLIGQRVIVRFLR